MYKNLQTLFIIHLAVINGLLYWFAFLVVMGSDYFSKCMLQRADQFFIFSCLLIALVFEFVFIFSKRGIR